MKKGEATKEHLIACAGRLFWQNGYAATGLSEILKEAHLTKGSFYFYFKSKEDLAVAVVGYYHRVVYEWLGGRRRLGNLRHALYRGHAGRRQKRRALRLSHCRRRYGTGLFP